MINQPPYAEISEMTVIGQCMVYDYCIKEAAQLLRIDDFYLSANKILYKIILDINSDGAVPDVQVVGQRLLDRKLQDKIGGLEVLSKYIDAVCTGQNLSYHAKIIKEKAALRSLMFLADDITNTAAGQRDPQEFLQESKKNIAEIAQLTAEKKPVEAITDNISPEVSEILSGKPPPGLVATGIPSVDRKTGGLCSDLLTVVAGRPSMGKSTLLLNMAINIGLRGQKVLYFTLEDAARYQRRRMLARMARANLHRVMINSPNSEESTRIIEAKLFIEKRTEPLFWIQDQVHTPEQIMHSAATHAASTGLDVLMIDHLGYVKAPGKIEYEVVSNAVRELTLMAKELRLPVVLAVQLNRKPEDRDKRSRPRLSDLRGSGHIEEDARIIWFVHHDKKEAPNTLELNVAKASHGETGLVSLYCDLKQVYICDKQDSGDGIDYNSPHEEIGYNG